MNLKSLTIFVVLKILFTSCQDHTDSPLHLFSNQIPSDSASIFGEGIISTDGYEFAITSNPEMDEIFFTRRNPGENNAIYIMNFMDGAWSTPEPAFYPQMRAGILNLMSPRTETGCILEVPDLLRIRSMQKDSISGTVNEQKPAGVARYRWNPLSKIALSCT